MRLFIRPSSVGQYIRVVAGGRYVLLHKEVILKTILVTKALPRGYLAVQLIVQR
jgi:hypothetical protein